MLWKERTLRVGMKGALVWLEKRWQVYIVGEGRWTGRGQLVLFNAAVRSFYLSLSLSLARMYTERHFITQEIMVGEWHRKG
jgi:hypothetical protein